MPIATPARPSAHPERTEETDYGPGDLIASKYRLQHLIGEGGMGTVWLARNMTLHADVALKLVRRQIAGSDEAAQRLLTEARATAQLEHPAIVKIHDFGETERGDPFIVMELLKGESLDDMIEELGVLPAPFVGQVLLPILSALTVVHDKGIVHRDIKPDNIILVPDGADGYLPKLVDFGIARLRYRTVETDEEAPEETAERVTRMGRILGSPEFMSPEQARGDLNVDGRTDIWSLTIVLYHAITGDFPFVGDDMEHQLLSILADPPVSLEAHGLPDAELWNVIEKGLQKPLAMRWKDANAMGRALAAWLMNQGVDADITGRSLRRQWTDLRGSRAPNISNYPSVPPPAFSSAPGLGSSPPGRTSRPGVSSVPPAHSSHPSIPGAIGSDPSIPPPGLLPREGRLSSDSPGPLVGDPPATRNGVGRAVVVGGVLLAAIGAAAFFFARGQDAAESAPAHTSAPDTPALEETVAPEPTAPAADSATTEGADDAADEADESSADEGEDEAEAETKPRPHTPRPRRPRVRPKASATAEATATPKAQPPPPPEPKDGSMPLPDDAMF